MRGLLNNIRRIALCAVFLIIFVWSWISTEFDIVKLFSIQNTIHFITHDWLPPDWGVLPAALRDSVITLQIAFMGTTIAVIVALPVSFLAAKNTSPYRSVYNVGRIILSFIRSVPEIVWGLLLVVTIGLGPFTGVLAIMLHNIGVLGKLYSELIEAAESGPPEAVTSTGAPKFLVIIYGYLPQILPNILSQYFYRFEVGVRTSLILGFIGAGGIGNRLFIDFKTFSYNSVATEVLVIMVLVIVIDYLGSLFRNKVI